MANRRSKKRESRVAIKEVLAIDVNLSGPAKLPPFDVVTT